MAMDYKSRDLDYKLQEKGYKNAVLDHRLACSTINKMGIVLETLMDCVQDLPGPIVLQLDGNRLQIQRPGLQNTGGRLQKCGVGPQNGLQHHQ